MDKKAQKEIRRKLIKKACETSNKMIRTQEKIMEELASGSSRTFVENHTLSNRSKKPCHLISLAKRMESIEEALQKLEDNKYGICECCGKDIPSQRLVSIPEARRCRSCQEKI